MYVCINHDLIRNQLKRNLNIVVCLFPIKWHVDGQTSSSPEYKSQLFLSPFLLLVADGQPALFPQTLHFFSCHYYQTLLLKSWVNLVQCTTRQVSRICWKVDTTWLLHCNKSSFACRYRGRTISTLETNKYGRLSERRKTKLRMPSQDQVGKFIFLMQF